MCNSLDCKGCINGAKQIFTPKFQFKRQLMRILFLVPAAALLAACSSIPSKPPQGSRAAFVILETTDLHANVRSYDYYKLAPDASLGLERTATLIRQARKEFPN